MCQYDFSLLIVKIKEQYGSQRNFAKALGMSEQSLSNKLNNTIAFSREDVELCLELLQIDREDISDYFFKRL